MRVSSISSQSLYNNYQSLSSGKKINSAADDAAGLAIAEKLESQVNGYDTANRNVGTAQDMTNIADGALGSITDSLQRMRELSIQASNDLYTATDKQAIQDEIDQLKQSISDVASQTQFNTMNLLDGSKTSFEVVTGPTGSDMDVTMPNSTLQALGIEDYDVTRNFDISAIDKAIETVNSARSKLGAQSNGMDHIMAYNSLASYNTTASQSRIEDLDYAKGISDMKKNELMNTFSLMMQRKKIENENGRVIQLFRQG